MTLVIAGYSSGDFEKGIYIAADSKITKDHGLLVVGGFKKVIDVPIRMKGLNFCSDWFNGYSDNGYEGSAVLAFAGDVVFAQHFVNSVKNHLSELYPTYRNGEHKVLMPCETGERLKNAYYDDDILLSEHLDNLLTAEYLSQVVLNSMECALKALRKAALTLQSFKRYRTEFIFGLQCPKTGEYELHQYEIVLDDEPGVGAKVVHFPILHGDIAVIGGNKIGFKTSALQALRQCPPNEKPSHTIFSFLNQSIDHENSIGNSTIGRPTFLYNLQVQTLKKIKIQS